MNNWTKYGADLPGVNGDYPEEFFRLAQVFHEQVFELYKKDGQICITYLMNDCVESYFVLHDGVMTGIYEEEMEKETKAAISRREDGYMLSIKQGGKNSFTIKFSHLELVTRTYEYHNIGHFWVEKQEYLRQLVYQLAIVKDKYIYFGEEYLTREEREILPLSEFGPLQSYICIKWDEKPMYGSSEEGLRVFEDILKTVDDKKIAFWFKQYKRTGYYFYEHQIAKLLCHPDHLWFYEYVEEKLGVASRQYESRSFGEKEDRLVNRCREWLEKQNISYLEEQPFTVWKGDFTMNFHMISYYMTKKKMEMKREMVKLVFEKEKGEEEIFQNFIKEVKEKC